MIKAIVTDIEGTTTSISFVTEVLFPYARERMSSFLDAHKNEADVATEINAVRAEIGDPEASLDIVKQTLQQWIDNDKKITPLKALQGMIWRSGYESGSLKGHLYPDVKKALESWHADGVSLNVYSSGSVAAQKLIFGFSVDGDLTSLFEHYFDTKIGGKREKNSYITIQQQLNVAPESILFLSDIVAELDAASEAGLQTLALDRECICEGFGAHPFVHNFGQIDLSKF